MKKFSQMNESLDRTKGYIVKDIVIDPQYGRVPSDVKKLSLKREGVVKIVIIDIICLMI